MNSHLLSCEKLEIPDALTLDHAELRTELMKATSEPGRLGAVAKSVARHYLPHFRKEEAMIFSAFEMLEDLAAERVQLEMAPVEQMIGQFNARHHAVLGDHHSINTAVEDLLLEARKAKNMEIVSLVRNLRHHEKIEDEVMYPTVLMFGQSVRNSFPKGAQL